jgi:NAD(P)-dependent dehydrogenase (short-subunit alcohol dehydrogenase family)
VRFDGKIAVVTGGAAGIGRATCTILARGGAELVIADQDLAQAEKTAAELSGDTSATVHPIRVDVAEESQLRALADFVDATYGRLDIVVNNAAARTWGPVTEADVDAWHSIVNINLISVGLTCKHLIPIMAKSGGGSIVNVSSANGIVGRPGMALYDATKAGVLGLTRSMACDHAQQNIRVNAILPGPTLTDFHKNRAAAEGREVDPNSTEPHDGGPGILRRQARPEEIAYPIAFLASDLASYMTGSCVSPDGGLSALSGRIG